MAMRVNFKHDFQQTRSEVRSTVACHIYFPRHFCLETFQTFWYVKINSNSFGFNFDNGYCQRVWSKCWHSIANFINTYWDCMFHHFGGVFRLNLIYSVDLHVNQLPTHTHTDEIDIFGHTLWNIIIHHFDANWLLLSHTWQSNRKSHTFYARFMFIVVYIVDLNTKFSATFKS